MKIYVVHEPFKMKKIPSKLKPLWKDVVQCFKKKTLSRLMIERENSLSNVSYSSGDAEPTTSLGLLSSPESPSNFPSTGSASVPTPSLSPKSPDDYDISPLEKTTTTVPSDRLLSIYKLLLYSALTVENTVSKFHRYRKHTAGARCKLHERIFVAHLAKVSGILCDLKRFPHTCKPYDVATTAEFQTLAARKILTVVPRSSVLAKCVFDRSTVILSTKLSRRVKARCVINERSQSIKLLEYFRSPTLSDDTLKICLAVAAHKYCT